MDIAMTYPSINRVGGVERVVVECANHLARGGHRVHAYATNWAPGVLDPQVERHHVRARRRPDALHVLQYRERATAAVDGGGHDVHASFGAASPLGGVFWVPSVHKAVLEILLARRTRAARLVQRCNPFHVLRLELEKQIYRPGGYTRLIACGDRVAEDIVRLYDVPEEDVVVQPYGYDPGTFNVERRNSLRPVTRERYGYAESDRVVVFAANELERKGFDTLLEGAALLRDPSLHLLVAGRVNPAPYRHEISRLGLAGRVRFAGSSPNVAAEYAAGDVFCLPTRYEPWGLVIVEALASGLPALTTRLAGAAVAVEPRRTGDLLDDPDDGEELAAKLGPLLDGHAAPAAEISSSVTRFSWPVVLERYEQILTGAAPA
jgi:UDP-glucose:(heptosyl)LPS alpha-1,3-glucosyltransferase